MQETSNGFRVEVPPRRRASAIVFSLVFIGLFALIGHIVVERLPSAPRIIFGVLVTVFGVICGVLLLASELWGTETIELDGSHLSVIDKIFVFTRTRIFDITLMKFLRLGASSYWQGSTHVMSEGRIQFEYQNAVVSMGGNITEEEAFGIVNRIHHQISAGQIPSGDGNPSHFSPQEI
jgi:hypothetical protein